MHSFNIFPQIFAEGTAECHFGFVFFSGYICENFSIADTQEKHYGGLFSPTFHILFPSPIIIWRYGEIRSRFIGFIRGCPKSKNPDLRVFNSQVTFMNNIIFRRPLNS
jgi:hypothetical protein